MAARLLRVHPTSVTFLRLLDASHYNDNGEDDEPLCWPSVAPRAFQALMLLYSRQVPKDFAEDVFVLQ